MTPEVLTVLAAPAEATRNRGPAGARPPLREQTEGAGISVWVTAVSLGHKGPFPGPKQASAKDMSNEQSLTRKHSLSSFSVLAMALGGYVRGRGHDDSKQRGAAKTPGKCLMPRGPLARQDKS